MQNFGKIKNAFNEIFAESIVDKSTEKKKVVKRFIKAISESKILKTQFLIYNNLETRVDENQFSSNLFITENINQMKVFSKKDIIIENQKLINLSQMVKSKIDLNYDNKSIHETISSLIFTDVTSFTISEITKCRMNLITYINNNTVKTIVESPEVPTSMLANLAVDKFNEKYVNLTEDEHKVLNFILEGGNTEDKESLFKSTVRSCLDSVKERLKESTNKEKLISVGEKLLSTEYVNETFIDDITKLLDLKRTLTIK